MYSDKSLNRYNNKLCILFAMNEMFILSYHASVSLIAVVFFYLSSLFIVLKVPFFFLLLARTSLIVNFPFFLICIFPHLFCVQYCFYVLDDDAVIQS